MFQPDDDNFLRNIILLWIVVFLIGLCSTARADSYSPASQWKLIDTEKLELQYSRMDPMSRDPYAPQYTGRWQERASLQWRVSILKFLYWDNDCHTETIDTGQVKTVGWHWEAGARINKYFTLFQEHHSRHIMDEPPETAYFKHNQFPVENSYGIRFKLIEEHNNGGLFR